jgi:hypothetical protein
VGGGLPAGDPGGREQWTLPGVVEHMQDAYCGTLTAQFEHLASRFVPVAMGVVLGVAVAVAGILRQRAGWLQVCFLTICTW